MPYEVPCNFIPFPGSYLFASPIYIPYAGKSRFGENAGEATGDVLATAGHCVCTCWNIFKIRKALNPASHVSSGVLKNAAIRR